MADPTTPDRPELTEQQRAGLRVSCDYHGSAAGELCSPALPVCSLRIVDGMRLPAPPPSEPRTPESAPPVAKPVACEHPLTHRMYKQDGVTGVCGRCGSVLRGTAPSPAREPAAVTVEQLVAAMTVPTYPWVSRALLERALAAADDNMRRRMLAAVEGGAK